MALPSTMAKTTLAASGAAAATARHTSDIMTVFPAASPDHRGTMHIPVVAAARITCAALVAMGCSIASLPTELHAFALLTITAGSRSYECAVVSVGAAGAQDVLLSRSELFLAEFSRLENSLTIETDARERRSRDDLR